MIHHWTITRAFTLVAARHGREQLSRVELVNAGVNAETIEAAVRAGDLKEGVQGLWRPRPSDPGFLSVVDTIYGKDDEDLRPNYTLADPGPIDFHSASHGKLGDRFGK